MVEEVLAFCCLIIVKNVCSDDSTFTAIMNNILNLSERRKSMGFEATHYHCATSVAHLFPKQPAVNCFRHCRRKRKRKCYTEPEVFLRMTDDMQVGIEFLKILTSKHHKISQIRIRVCFN